MTEWSFMLDIWQIKIYFCIILKFKHFYIN